MTARFATAALGLGATGMAVLWFLRGMMTPGTLRGVLLGMGLATAGSIAGLALTAWSFARPHGQFMAALLLGALGRMVIYGVTLIYIALGTSLNPSAMAIGLLATYLVFQVLEVRFVLKRMRMGKRQSLAER